MNETAREPFQPPSAVIESKPESAVPIAAVPDSVRRDPMESASAVSADKPRPQPKETASAAARASAERSVSPAKQTAFTKTAYSVQVAAFRAWSQVEVKVKELEVKGFESNVELPQASDDYYRIRVGSFDTRAEAAEMAKRLKEYGFETMIAQIKTN
jgi:cell division protein FtsN